MRARAAVSAVGLACALAACGPSDESNEVVTVAAAASTREVVTMLAQRFATDHPGVEVRVTTEGSATLVEQLRGGAPIDVLITADAATMDRAGSHVTAPITIAWNEPVVIVSPQSRGSIRGLDDLEGAVTAVCSLSQPCGAAAERLLATRPGVTPATLEPHVQSVVTKVALGEADAGVAYRTDALANPELGVIMFDAPPLAVTGAVTSTASSQAQALLDFLSSSAATSAWEQAGYVVGTAP